MSRIMFGGPRRHARGEACAEARFVPARRAGRRLGGALAALLAGAALAGQARAADFVVTSLADSGMGSLRDAIDAANANGEADTITFDETLAGGTILLSSGQLTIADDMADPDLTIDGDVDGDGTPDITVDAQDSSRVLEIASGADATLEGLVITGGSSESSSGGINNLGTLTVANSTISGNSGDFGGGSLNAGTLAVTNSTISGNSADLGGGIFNAGTLTVTNSTISDNKGFAPAIFNRAGMVELKSTIVSGNTATGAGADCFNDSDFGTLTSLGFNLEGGTSCGFMETGDQQNVDVEDVLETDSATGAALLADNGGPTQTIALLDGDPTIENPAVDAIPADRCTDTGGMPVLVDQRGIPRPQPADGDCDIGAFELQQETPVTIADVVELFDQAVADGSLTGAGPGNSAAGRLNALRNMLLAAGELLEQADVDGACTQLQDAADRTDGAFPPPDFVQGEAAPELLDAITGLQDDLGCFA